ncbi:MAG TPA: RNA polymerase sigma-70 factor [Fodinibius sp.]|nr:RNA polymerase sigma-70 factor [Fodinibius sp.]
MSQTTLFQKIKTGDEAAFEKLFREHYEGLRRFVWSFVGSNAVAEELVQETFLKIWEKREQLDVQQSIKAYLFRSARNNSIDWLRHKEVERKWKDEEKAHLKYRHTPDVSERLHHKKLLKEVKRAIQNLPQRQREVFMLSRYEHMTYKEIAEILGISVSTVETHISRALETLRKKFLPLFALLPFLLFI